METTATDTGEAQMAIWEATEPPPWGAPGECSLQRDVGDDGEHGVDHVAGTAQEGEGPGGERRQQGDVLGWRRSRRSATCIIRLRPPAVCRVAAQPITASMVSITCTGGSPGTRPKTKVSRKRPMPLMRPSPMPPKRVPSSKQPSTTKNSIKIIPLPRVVESMSPSARARDPLSLFTPLGLCHSALPKGVKIALLQQLAFFRFKCIKLRFRPLYRGAKSGK